MVKSDRLAAGWAAALLVAAAGAIHLYLWFDYFHRVHVVGALFLVNAGAGLALGAALLVRRGVLLLLTAGGYAAGTLAAFVTAPVGACSATGRRSGGAGRRLPEA